MTWTTPRWTCVAAGVLLLAWQTVRSADAPATQPTTQIAIADTQPTTQPTAAVKKLVDELSDDSFKVREDAQADLIRMAEAAEPSLKALLNTDLSPEAKARVEASLRKIEENRQLGPSIITLHYTDAPLDTILDDFSKQAGADLGTHRKEIADFVHGKKATVNVDHASFWAALQAVSAASGLTVPIYNGGNGGRMTLEISGRFGPGLDLPAEGVAFAGPFVIVPQNCTMTRVVNYGHGIAMGPANSQFSLTLMCICEPKVRVVGGIGNDNIKQIVDEKGHDLLAGGNGNMFYGMGQSWCWTIAAQLREVPDMGKKMASLKGVIKASVRTKSIDFVVDDVFKSGQVTKRIGNLTITFTGATTQNNQTLLNFSVVAPADANAYNQIQMLVNEMEVTDVNGQRIQVGLRSMNGNGQRMDLSVGSFGGPNQKPQKLVWEIPSETRPVEFPFEIHDLALPQ